MSQPVLAGSKARAGWWIFSLLGLDPSNTKVCPRDPQSKDKQTHDFQSEVRELLQLTIPARCHYNFKASIFGFS